MKKWILLPSVFLVTIVVWLVARRLGPSGPPGREVTVYAYSSFVASWGAGPALAKAFENAHSVRIRLIEVGDARLLAKRIQSEKERVGADLIIGLDQFSVEEVRKEIPWQSLNLEGLNWESTFPRKSEGLLDFVPFDWSPMAFIFRKGEIRPPAGLDDLRSPEYARSLSLMDPRTSTPGYQFLEWVLEHTSESGLGAFLVSLQPSLVSYSPSWSTAYGIFKKKEAKLVFSYLTSPVYHWKEEKDFSYQSAVFESGHPYQVEYAAIPRSCRSCKEAESFLRFLLTPEAQAIVMNANTMMPVIAGVKEGTLFAELPSVKLLEPPSRDPQEIQRLQDLWKATVK